MSTSAVPVKAGAAQHADGGRAPERRSGIDAMHRAFLAHDDAAAEKPHTGDDIGGDLSHTCGAVAGQRPERDEQRSAARDERDRAQTRRALANLALEANRHAAGKRGQQPPNEIGNHKHEVKMIHPPWRSTERPCGTARSRAQRERRGKPRRAIVCDGCGPKHGG
jgi:hypothetical protein